MGNKNSFFSDRDLCLFSQGSSCHAYQKLGAHFAEQGSARGVNFAVWAPNARRVSVVGDFNNWDELSNPLYDLNAVGIWEGFVPGVIAGQTYKYSIHSAVDDSQLLKIDPYAFFAEVPPRSASVVWDISSYSWGDEHWMNQRAAAHRMDKPLCIYEVHLGSWRRRPEEGGAPLTYRQLAQQLPAYVRDMGFTHVGLLPLAEYPFDASLGYQPLGFFSPTSRYGTPQDFMYLVDQLHQAGVGIIMDWICRHFPADRHGLAAYDGACLYEYQDRRKAQIPAWGTLSFDFGRPEVISFLTSSAVFWLEKYHLDGLRVDGLSSMLCLDYLRDDGEWVPNEQGGRENIEAISFLRHFNETVYQEYPDIFTLAEESASWPMVSRPTYAGGLGFGYKWNGAWANEILSYMSKDPVSRTYHHNSLTSGLQYAYTENFVLPISHNEWAKDKTSVLRRMSGDDWQKLANLRLLLGLMYAHPGKKLLFMGTEFAQWDEWEPGRSLDWHLLAYAPHQGMQRWVKDLNFLLRAEPALHQSDFSPEGFSWLESEDRHKSCASFIRHGCSAEDALSCVFNFTPVPRHNYRLGVPREGYWEELLNSDAGIYGGSGLGNLGGVFAETVPASGQPLSLNITLPPLAALFFRISRG